MTYGKLKSGVLTYAPKNVVVDDVLYIPATEEALVAAGYKKVYYTDYPTDGNVYESGWHETAKRITQTWTMTHELTPAERRERAYKERPIIDHGGSLITVDAAVKLWYQYTAEGRDMSDLQTAISAAKEAIRAEYPDANEVTE